MWTIAGGILLALGILVVGYFILELLIFLIAVILGRLGLGPK